MTAFRVCAAILAIALAHILAPAHVDAAENPSYAAYSQGRYLTALKLAEQEATQGSKEAYTLIGEIYAEGLGVAQDFGKAADAYAKAADLGDPNAQFSLALMVAEGLGVKRDLRIAANLFEKSAESGNPAAQYNLALIYLAGKGRSTDEAKAAEWMQKAAAAGNPQAQYDLGALYQFGRGVPIDKKQAAEWTGRAADAGLADAQVEYGVMLFKGQGVPADEVARRQALPACRRAGQPRGPEPARAALCQRRGGEGRSRPSREMAFAGARRRCQRLLSRHRLVQAHAGRARQGRGSGRELARRAVERVAGARGLTHLTALGPRALKAPT